MTLLSALASMVGLKPRSDASKGDPPMASTAQKIADFDTLLAEIASDASARANHLVEATRLADKRVEDEGRARILRDDIKADIDRLFAQTIEPAASNDPPAPEPVAEVPAPVTPDPAPVAEETVVEDLPPEPVAEEVPAPEPVPEPVAEPVDQVLEAEPVPEPVNEPAVDVPAVEEVAAVDAVAEEAVPQPVEGVVGIKTTT